jgi:nitrate reductase gamma subunit
MFDLLIFVGLPYLALTALVAGVIYRLRHQGLTVSAMSSQALEPRSLPWGSLPWHMGIFVVIAGHLVAFAAPDAWRGLMAQRWALLAAETLGLAAAALCAIGLTVLFVRRVTNARLQAVTTRADLLVLALLLAQVLLGIATAVSQRWGAAWSTTTTTPYLWSVVTFSPDVSFVADMPGIIKLHIALAWLLFLVTPFTRLIHALTVPLQYLWRLPQRVVWINPRHERALAMQSPAAVPPEDSRRALLRGLAGMAGAVALLATGVAGKLIQYFRGPAVARADKEALLSKRLTQLKVNAQERSLQLERIQHDHILVAKLPELDPKQGKYFIDYHMRPALAFLDPTTGLPILLSARCTHLGCTVSNTLDDQGRVLCPCHVSYFDIRTGQPNAGAPATEPLPRIAFLIKTPDGAVAASQDTAGTLTGAIDPAQAHTYSVFIARPDA